MEIAIINTELFKENSPIKDDTMISKFVPYILIAQKLYIAPQLGPELMTEIQQQIKDASVTPPPAENPISEANQALIQIIAPALSFYAVYQGLPFHWAAVVNKGITLGGSENSTSIDIKGLAQLRTWVKDDAEGLVKNIVEYLNKCRANYPKWVPLYKNECQQKREEYDFGITIPRRGPVRRF